jgi:hypothetical protein
MARRPRADAVMLAPTTHVHSDEYGIDMHLALTGLRGRLRLLAGMVRGNRPWRLVPHLSTATVAAAARLSTGSSPVTSGIWPTLSPPASGTDQHRSDRGDGDLAADLQPPVERPAGRTEREEAMLYNASTLLTLFLGVAAMYAILYMLTLLAAATLIDSGYLQFTLRHRVGSLITRNWCGWTSSVGIVAGALGSSLESEEAIRKATCSKREQERQARTTASDKDSVTLHSRQKINQWLTVVPAGQAMASLGVAEWTACGSARSSSG